MKAIISDLGGRVPMRKKPTPTSRSQFVRRSCAFSLRSRRTSLLSDLDTPERVPESTRDWTTQHQRDSLNVPSFIAVPAITPVSDTPGSSRRRSSTKHTTQPDPETLSDTSLAHEILSQQPRNKTRGASVSDRLGIVLASDSPSSGRARASREARLCEARFLLDRWQSFSPPQPCAGSGLDLYLRPEGGADVSSTQTGLQVG